MRKPKIKKTIKRMTRKRRGDFGLSELLALDGMIASNEALSEKVGSQLKEGELEHLRDSEPHVVSGLRYLRQALERERARLLSMVNSDARRRYFRHTIEDAAAMGVHAIFTATRDAKIDLHQKGLAPKPECQCWNCGIERSTKAFRVKRDVRRAVMREIPLPRALIKALEEKEEGRSSYFDPALKGSDPVIFLGKDDGTHPEGTLFAETGAELRAAIDSIEKAAAPMEGLGDSTKRATDSLLYLANHAPLNIDPEPEDRGSLLESISDRQFFPAMTIPQDYIFELTSSNEPEDGTCVDLTGETNAEGRAAPTIGREEARKCLGAGYPEAFDITEGEARFVSAGIHEKKESFRQCYPETEEDVFTQKWSSVVVSVGQGDDWEMSADSKRNLELIRGEVDRMSVRVEHREITKEVIAGMRNHIVDRVGDPNFMGQKIDPEEFQKAFDEWVASPEPVIYAGSDKKEKTD